MPILPDLRRRLHDRERESSRLEDCLRGYDRTAPLAPLSAEFEDALDRAENALLEAVLERAIATEGREPSATHWVWHYLQIAPTAAAGCTDPVPPVGLGRPGVAQASGECHGLSFPWSRHDDVAGHQRDVGAADPDVRELAIGQLLEHVLGLPAGSPGDEARDERGQHRHDDTCLLIDGAKPPALREIDQCVALTGKIVAE